MIGAAIARSVPAAEAFGLLGTNGQAANVQCVAGRGMNAMTGSTECARYAVLSRPEISLTSICFR